MSELPPLEQPPLENSTPELRLNAMSTVDYIGGVLWLIAIVALFVYAVVFILGTLPNFAPSAESSTESSTESKAESVLRNPSGRPPRGRLPNPRE